MRKNTVFLRETLGAAILHVRSGRATSRTLLAKELGISPSTVGLYVDRLIAEKFLDESGVNQGKMGRPQRLLALRAEVGWFAGVEFTAHRMQAVAVDFSGCKVASVARALPTNVSPDMVIQAIVASVVKLAETVPGKLLGVGLGVPGVVDPEKGVGMHFAFMPQWNHVPVVSRVQEKLNVPVILQNNLRAIALAERWFGMGHEVNDYVILGARSGFGIAIVQQGRLVNGANHAAGEVGRWTWPPTAGSGPTDEAHYALSAPSTWRRLAGASPQADVPEDWRAALADVAHVSGKVWEAVCTDFAKILGCVQLITDTSVMILHGPLTVLGERFCDDIVAMVRTLFPALAVSGLKVVPSQLGDDAGALGAASLAMESWAPE